jgi:hypothetical protein
MHLINNGRCAVIWPSQNALSDIAKQASGNWYNWYCGGGQSVGTDTLRCLATGAQDAATLVDLMYAVPEMGIAVVGTLGAGPETIPEVVIGTDIVYNLTGGNELEMGLSFGSTFVTGLADYIDNGKLGEDFTTSALCSARRGSPDPAEH